MIRATHQEVSLYLPQGLVPAWTHPRLCSLISEIRSVIGSKSGARLGLGEQCIAAGPIRLAAFNRSVGSTDSSGLRFASHRDALLLAPCGLWHRLAELANPAEMPQNQKLGVSAGSKFSKRAQHQGAAYPGIASWARRSRSNSASGH